MEQVSGEWRVLAQRITTGEWLTKDLPLKQSATSRELSGPGGVYGVLNPEVLRLRADDGRPLIEEWTTALYVEESNKIRHGGIVNRVERDKPVKTIDAAGFSHYPHGVPYMADYRPDDFPDPIALFRHLWEYAQSYPDSNLGVTVGGAEETYFALSSGEGPFILNSFDYRDIGQLHDQLASTVPFDFLEHHEWADDRHKTVKHTVNIGFPRVGRRRTDLRFADSENIVDFDPIAADGENYANDVYGFGMGEGRGMLTARATVRDGRLRRPAVLMRKAATEGVLTKDTQAELRRRELKLDIRSLTVKDHKNARIGAITPGDDVLVELEVPWAGDVRMWLRVLAVNESGEAPGQAVLKTQRSDSFVYAAGKSPTGERQVLTL